MSDKPLVIITGASSGIGLASARLFSAAGYPLLLIARRLERLTALQLPNTLCEAVDVTDINAFQAAIEKAENAYGPCDCIINNAGVMLLGKVATQESQEWQTMINVNISGVLNGIKSVLANMQTRKTGTIINISSIAGLKAFPDHAVYCATKYAVRGLTETLRMEVANSGIRVISICPGVVETELLGHTTSDEIVSNYETWKKEIGGAITPQNIADTLLFAYQQPQNVCIREITLAPTAQEP